MFSSLLGLAVGGVNPFSQVRRFIWIALIAAVALALGYAAYKTYDAFAFKREGTQIINNQKEKIEQQKDVIADQSNQSQKVTEGKQAENDIIVVLVDKKKKTAKETEAVIEKVAEQIEQIAVAPDKTPEQKAVEVAQVQIDALWDNFCAKGGAHASCTAPAGIG